jgi:D-glycero-alpha-D-manno-heptose-7-phosphate kinase
MIVTKTPLRISLFGGGSDLPEYYTKKPGAVLNFTIDKFMYITINKTPKHYVKAIYDRIETVDSVNELAHDRVRESLKIWGIRNGIEIASFCEMPTKGTGLGSSSTFTVGLNKALDASENEMLTKFQIAELAYDIERVKCNENLGKQDQYAATFGGFNKFTFHADGSVDVAPTAISRSNMNALRDNLMLYYTGIKRVANNILVQQAQNIKENINTLDKMVELAIHAEDCLIGKQSNMDEIGKMLDQAWKYKKELANDITNDTIDEMYSKAIKAGALGGKIIGAGGGGFMLLYVPLKKRDRVKVAMQDYEEFDDFNFTEQGTEVVYNDRTTRFN